MTQAIHFGLLGRQLRQQLSQLLRQFRGLRLLDWLGIVGCKVFPTLRRRQANPLTDSATQAIQCPTGRELLQQPWPVGDLLPFGNLHGIDECFLETVGRIGLVGKQTVDCAPHQWRVLANDPGPVSHSDLPNTTLSSTHIVVRDRLFLTCCNWKIPGWMQHTHHLRRHHHLPAPFATPPHQAGADGCEFHLLRSFCNSNPTVTGRTHAGLLSVLLALSGVGPPFCV